MEALFNFYNIDLTQKEEEDLKTMCNLGEGLYEDGLIKGMAEGKAEGPRHTSNVHRRHSLLFAGQVVTM